MNIVTDVGISSAEDEDDVFPTDYGFLLGEPAAPGTREKDLRVGYRGNPRPNRLRYCHNWKLYLLVAMACLTVGLIFALVYLQSHCAKSASSGLTTGEVDTDSGNKTGQDQGCDLWKDIRLPDAVIPEHYALKIHPNLDSFTFTGSVEIRVSLSEATDLMVLHNKNLKILPNFRFTTMGGGGKPVKVEQFRECKKLEQICFKLEERLSMGKKMLVYLEFSGNLSSEFSGLYKSGYINSQRQTENSAVTQFEPTDARAMFPCFDEPALKATFSVSVIRKDSETSLANMNVLRHQTVNGSLVEDVYAESVRMSTYLVAIAVLNGFSFHSRASKTGVQVSVYAPQELVNNTEFALGIAVDGLEFLEDFFNISFPLPKQDLLAVSDFSSGAMENWGLITFRDYLLLYNPDRSPTKSKERIATVIVHELAHQWFGNLVTMKWWNDLWLNEGFASYIEYLVTSEMKPEWNLMESFYKDNTAQGLYLDGLSKSHAISSPVNDPAEIGSIFDAISYQKGACFINMIMALAGKGPFRAGLTDYLNKYQYKNAEANDLWNVLNEHMASINGKSLMDFAKSWTTQVGYPLVSVFLSNDKKEVFLNQTRFLYLEKHRQKQLNDNRTVWPIPITYKTVETALPVQTWLTSVDTIDVTFQHPISWFKANINGTGFFRVLYDRTLYAGLKNLLKSNPKALSEADRVSLLYDSFSLLRAGLLDVHTVFTLLEYATDGREVDKDPWAFILGQLSGLESLVWDTDLYPLLRKYKRSLVVPLYSRLGWTLSTDYRQRLHQLAVLYTACDLELQDCLGNAQVLFKNWVQNELSISADLKPVVVSMGVKYGNATIWNFVYERYKLSTSPSEQNVLLHALASSRDPWILTKFLRMTLNRHLLKPNIMSTVVASVAGNPVGQTIAWRFVKVYWNDILDLLGKTSMLGYLIEGVIGSFSTKYEYEEAKLFLLAKDLGKVNRKIEQTLERIEVNIQFRNLNEVDLGHWLDQWQTLQDQLQ